MSIRNNPYFDINVKTSLSESMHLWLMGNSQSKKTLFLQKHEVKSPVKFPDCLLRNLRVFLQFKYWFMLQRPQAVAICLCKRWCNKMIRYQC